MKGNFIMENFETQDDIIENEENNDIVTISRYDFNSFAIERSVRDLVDWASRDKVFIPDFQRAFVWDFNKCCKFIESILLDLPIPNMFMFKDRTSNAEKYILIDGLQRFTCINQFKKGVYDNGEMKKDFKINIKNSNWFGKTYLTLDDDDKYAFDDYALRINVFDSIENNELLKKKYMIEVFERINTGAEKLTDQEIRNAVYSSQATAYLKEYASSRELHSLLVYTSKYSDKRCNDQEFVLRVITYYHIYNVLITGGTRLVENEESKITTSKKNMLSDYLYFASINKIDILKELNVFKDAINKISNFSNKCFIGVSNDEPKLTKSVHEVFAEALTIYVMLGNEITVDYETFERRKVDYWYNTDKKDNPFYTATTGTNSIKDRIIVMKRLVEE